jgi:hypothetical protein
MAAIAPVKLLRAPRVFISYSHDGCDHENTVLELADRLRNEGVDANLDLYEPVPLEGWPQWTERQIQDADFVLVICTEPYYRKVADEVPQGTGLGVVWEAKLIYQQLYDNPANDRFLPVVFRQGDVRFIPTPLQSKTRYDLSDSKNYEALYRHITGQPSVLKPELGRLKALPARRRSGALANPQAADSQPLQYSCDPLVAEVVDLTTFAPNFPYRPTCEVGRDHILHTLQTLLSRDIGVVTLEGEDGIGKTTILAQFARSLPNNTISVFIRADDRSSYDADTIQRSLLDQVYWACNNERLPWSDVPRAELNQLYGDLQRRARRKGVPHYFVVDGIGDLGERSPATVTSMLEFLPIDREGFKFIFTGEISLYASHLPASVTIKSFPLVEFSLDETLKYLADVVHERALAQDIHKISRGLPGRLADVRRATRAGIALPDCLNALSKSESNLFFLEWQRLDKSDDCLRKLLAILSHDEKRHTVVSASELAGIPAADAKVLIESIAFLNTGIRGEVFFASDAFRRFVADQLRALKNWVHKTNIKRLLSRPDSVEAIVELPFYFREASEFQLLVDYLTPQHILTMLRRTQSLARVQATVEAGRASARRLGRDGDMLRFGIEESLLLHFLNSGSGIEEAEALVSLGDYTAATTLANAALLREDRLQILATIARGKRKKGHAVETELSDQIRVLCKQIEPKGLGQRAIDIAAQLICVDPELALDLVDRAKPSDLEKERAMARLSVLTLEALGRDRSHQALDQIKARGFEDKVDLLQTSMAALSGKWSVPELIASVEKIGKSKDKLFLFKSWLRANRSTERLSEVIKYALDLAIRMTDFQLDATVLLNLANPLHKVAPSAGLGDLVGMFEAQMGAAAKLGPSVDYVRLQLALARCEVQYDKEACENRLIGLFCEITQFSDVGIRAEGFAWLLDGIAEIEAIAPYSVQFAVGADSATELDASFVALLDGTADHYRAAAGVIKALTRAHFEKALEFIDMLNTEARRDRALADVVFTLFDERRGAVCSALPIRRAMAKIVDKHLREHTLLHAIEFLADLDPNEIAIDDDLRELLEASRQIACSDSRCLACARSYVLLTRVANKGWIPLSEDLLETISTAWKAIDLAWLRAAVGFQLAQILAPVRPDASASYLEATEAFRKQIGGLVSKSAGDAYWLCLCLAARAFAGLVPKHAYSQPDLDSLSVLISAVPSAGQRALLWADLALRCAIQGNVQLCGELVNEKLRPTIAEIPEGDADFREFVISSCAPALFEANRAAALGMLQGLQLGYRDDGYFGIVSYLFRRQPPDEPEDYVPGSGYNISYGDLLTICDVASQLDSDSRIYDVIEKSVDCLTSKTLTVSYNNSQKEELYRRLQDLVTTKLPSPRHIRHQGYRVIGRAQLARFRNDPDIDGLVDSAIAIPNTADRALVMFTTGISIVKQERAIGETLLHDAHSLVGEIPAYLDRLERMLGFAYEAKPINQALSRKMLEEAMGLIPRLTEGRNRSLRDIVDLAHRIEPGFAKTLVERLDDDKVRQRAKRELELLDLKQKVADEQPVYEELQIASTTEYQKLGAMLLGSLQSDRMESIKLQAMRPCIETVGRHPIKRSYSVLAWIVQNAVEKHASSDRSQYVIYPLFQATLAGAELAGQLANRSFESLRAAQEISAPPHGVDKGKSNEVYGKEQAIAFVRSWLEDSAQDSLVICDPSFGPEDLVLVQAVRAVSTACRVDVLTCRPKANPPDGLMWEDVYVAQWRDLSQQSPPPTRIVMISSTTAAECPVQSSWMISGDRGLELAGSMRTLEGGEAFTFRPMESSEVATLRDEIGPVLSGGQEWAGRKVRYVSFTL